jgi:hypothetical protein
VTAKIPIAGNLDIDIEFAAYGVPFGVCACHVCAQR